MPNVAKVLREEIARISRHEAKVATTPVRKSTAKLRPDVADLKNRVAVLEKANAQLGKQVASLIASQPAPIEEPAAKARITGRAMKRLRGKLGLSQDEFGKLTGVSSHAVYLWESKLGMLTLRDVTRKTIMAVRDIGKTEARERLDEMGKKVMAKAGGKKDVARRRR